MGFLKWGGMIEKLLKVETRKLKQLFARLPEDVAGHIKFPDPVTHYPSIIQSVHLLGIHEKHHFAFRITVLF